MKPDRATAILALVEASKALQMAHAALRKLGDKDRADEVSDMGADTMALIGELSVTREQVIEVVA